MTLSDRQPGTRHQTTAAQVAQGDPYADFTVGQRVLTREGFLGTVTAVSDGPHAGGEAYEVVLDNGMGGGTWGGGELSLPQAAGSAGAPSARPTVVSRRTAAVAHACTAACKSDCDGSTHIASESYPELEAILVDRPPPAHATRVASLQPEAGRIFDKLLTWNANNMLDRVDPGNSRDKWQPGHDWSHDWCAYRDHHQCHFPGEHNPTTGRNEAGPIGRVRGDCSRKSWPDQQMCPAAAPGQHAGELGSPTASVTAVALVPNPRTTSVVCPSCEGDGLDALASMGEDSCQRCDGNRVVVASSLDQDEAVHVGRLVGERAAWRDQRMATGPVEAAIVPSALYVTAADHQVLAGPVDDPAHAADLADYYAGTVTAGNALQAPAWSGRTSGIISEAAWKDVRTKAQRISGAGGVRIISSTHSIIAAHVHGDTRDYESVLEYVPGTRQVGMWTCGCTWASYVWGRSAPYKRFEGRMCSHALATLYQAQSRGMFGKEVREDRITPAWRMDPTLPVLQPGSWDKEKQKHTGSIEVEARAPAKSKPAATPYSPPAALPGGLLAPHSDAHVAPSGRSRGRPHNEHATEMSGLDHRTQQVVRDQVHAASPDKSRPLTHEQTVQNIMGVYRHAAKHNPAAIHEGNTWYQTAHNFSKSLGERSGISHHHATGMVAAISPQMEWGSNKQVAHHMARHLTADTTVNMSEEHHRAVAVDSMSGKGDGWLRKKGFVSGDPSKGTRKIHASAQEIHDAWDKEKPKSGKQHIERPVVLKQGARLSEMSTTHAAHALKGIGKYQESWDDPENQVEDKSVRKVRGQPRATRNALVRWGSGTGAMAKGVGIYRHGAAEAGKNHGEGAEHPDQALGGHKVRSFFNNIMDPTGKHGRSDVTMDTHAVSVAAHAVMSASSHAINKMFYKNTPRETGSETPTAASQNASGSYAHFGDAYREAHSRLQKSGEMRSDSKPHHLQAATWIHWRHLTDNATKSPLRADFIGSVPDHKNSGKGGADTVKPATKPNPFHEHQDDSGHRTSALQPPPQSAPGSHKGAEHGLLDPMDTSEHPDLDQGTLADAAWEESHIRHLEGGGDPEDDDAEPEEETDAQKGAWAGQGDGGGSSDQRISQHLAAAGLGHLVAYAGPDPEDAAAFEGSTADLHEELREVSPLLSSHDASYLGGRDAEGLPYVGAAFSGGAASADLDYLAFEDLGEVVAGASVIGQGSPLLGFSVSDVVGVGPQEPVGRVLAGTEVAGVQDVQGSGWADQVLVSPLMGVDHTRRVVAGGSAFPSGLADTIGAIPEVAVATPIEGSSPGPAGRRVAAGVELGQVSVQSGGHVQQGTLHDDEPEPALPTTDGADEDDEHEPMQRDAALAPADGLAWIMEGSSGQGNAEIAGAASAFLKQGMRAFTPDERNAIIGEGEGTRAANLGRLDITGTHYEGLAALDEQDEGDDGWLS